MQSYGELWQPLAVFMLGCQAVWLLSGLIALARVAGWLTDLAAWGYCPARIWLPNLCLAGNPVTRIPDFVQPCHSSPIKKREFPPRCTCLQRHLHTSPGTSLKSYAKFHNPRTMGGSCPPKYSIVKRLWIKSPCIISERKNAVNSGHSVLLTMHKGSTCTQIGPYHTGWVLFLTREIEPISRVGWKISLC